MTILPDRTIELSHLWTPVGIESRHRIAPRAWWSFWYMRGLSLLTRGG